MSSRQRSENGNRRTIEDNNVRVLPCWLRGEGVQNFERSDFGCLEKYEPSTLYFPQPRSSNFNSATPK